MAEFEALEQYKLYVEMADRTTLRRGSFSGVFVSVNAIVVAAGGVLADRGFALPSPVVFCCLVVGLLLCCTWFLGLRSYKVLLKAKWNVIQDIECRLPESPFTDEWKVVGSNRGIRGGYVSIVWVESLLIVSFASIYLTSFFFLVFF